MGMKDKAGSTRVLTVPPSDRKAALFFAGLRAPSCRSAAKLFAVFFRRPLP
jgi:hypothetical protein